MLEFLKAALESGEHLIEAVGIGGTTQRVLAHTFIEALIAKMESVDPVAPVAPVVTNSTETHPAI